MSTPSEELFNLICNKEIGRGVSRVVYDSLILPDSVIKVENKSGSFENAFEWNIWREVEYTQYAKWFAPCEWISSCGVILIMKKTQPAVKYPSEMPAFLGDFKKKNYGLYGKKVVCHDYGNLSVPVIKTGLTKRMQKIREWS
jgi:hypothetical protein